MAAAVSPGSPRALLAECAAGDSAALFERHSVEEIRGAERAVRADIELKKEELRLMVGERYRDLMEAADTMAGMRASAERVRAAVRAMGAHCQGPQPALGLPGAPVASPRRAAEEERGRERFFALAAQVRLVLGVPERIWGWLEAGRHLEAARLCLLCGHVMASLGAAGGAAGPACPPLLARFPLLARQAAAAAHFRSAILQESRSVLRVRAVADQAVTDALCAVMLLEEASPRQAFADFLLARKSVVQGLLNEPQHGSSIKAQVCAVVESLATTLYQVHAVFYSPGDEAAAPDARDAPCGLLFSTLESLASDSRSGTGQGVLSDWAGAEAWGRHLPPGVLSFRPVPTMVPARISLQHLRDSLLHWVALCREDVSLGVRRLLPFVRSLRGLAGIRDAVWELLASEGLARCWGPTCGRLLGRPLSLWDEFLRPLFMRRVEELLQETLGSIAASSQQALQAAVAELGTPRHLAGPSPETDASSYLWTESPGDLAPHAAWGGAPAAPVASAASSESGLEAPAWAGLTMKARGHTPMVQGLCAALDAKLRARIEDVATYLPPAGSPGPAPPAPQDGAGFERFADAGHVRDTLQRESGACVTALAACARGHLEAFAELPRDGDDDGRRRRRLAVVLFVARLCRAIPELCPSLRAAGGARGPGAGGVGGAVGDAERAEPACVRGVGRRRGAGGRERVRLHAEQRQPRPRARIDAQLGRDRDHGGDRVRGQRRLHDPSPRAGLVPSTGLAVRPGPGHGCRGRAGRPVGHAASPAGGRHGRRPLGLRSSPAARGRPRVPGEGPAAALRPALRARRSGRAARGHARGRHRPRGPAPRQGAGGGGRAGEPRGPVRPGRVHPSPAAAPPATAAAHQRAVWRPDGHRAAAHGTPGDIGPRGPKPARDGLHTRQVCAAAAAGLQLGGPARGRASGETRDRRHASAVVSRDDARALAEATGGGGAGRPTWRGRAASRGLVPAAGVARRGAAARVVPLQARLAVGHHQMSGGLVQQQPQLPFATKWR